MSCNKITEKEYKLIVFLKFYFRDKTIIFDVWYPVQVVKSKSLHLQRLVLFVELQDPNLKAVLNCGHKWKEKREREREKKNKEN